MLKDLQGHSIQYRIAVGPHKGRKVFMPQSLPPLTGDRAGESLAKAAGFSLHAGVATQAHQKNILERVARYITRPPVAIERHLRALPNRPLPAYRESYVLATVSRASAVRILKHSYSVSCPLPGDML